MVTNRGARIESSKSHKQRMVYIGEQKLEGITQRRDNDERWEWEKRALFMQVVVGEVSIPAS